MKSENQQELNDTEWNNPDNWAAPKHLGIYFSKKDTRLWVPKSIPSMGWTINFGHRKAWVWLLILFVLFTGLGALLALLFQCILSGVCGSCG